MEKIQMEILLLHLVVIVDNFQFLFKLQLTFHLITRKTDAVAAHQFFFEAHAIPISLSSIFFSCNYGWNIAP